MSNEIYNDEKLIDDKFCEKYKSELTIQKQNASDLFLDYQTKIINQNILNIAGKLLGLLTDETTFLKELSTHLENDVKNECIAFIETLKEEISSLNILYEITSFSISRVVRVSVNAPLLQKCINLAIMIIKTLLELDNYELNSKIKDILKKYIEENLELLQFFAYLIK